MTTVVNKYKSPYDIYIGRGSKWGNPFVVGKDGNRDEVIAKYKEWIAKQPHLMASLHELKDKRLGCFCAPKSCHGDVLVELAEGDICEGCNKAIKGKVIYTFDDVRLCLPCYKEASNE